jgi:beta-N-acetylhexosaminidase
MCGHIALPAYEGLADDPAAAMPATLNPRLQVDLLRETLGFEGVIVSDAAPMIGMASRVRSDQAAIQNIASGSDVYLFGDARRDFERLLRAVENGALSEARVTASARRVLEMKARLGLHRGAFGPAPTAEQSAGFRRDAQAMADRSITLARASAVTPARLPPGSKVLTVTIRHLDARRELAGELTVIDDELRARGVQVDHWVNPSSEQLIEGAGGYAAVFVNVVQTPHARMGTIRLTGEIAMPFWRAFWVDHPNAVFTSFGSPYLLYELPHLPNLVLAYGPSEFSQRAAVKVWLGEMPAAGVAPVRL